MSAIMRSKNAAASSRVKRVNSGDRLDVASRHASRIVANVSRGTRSVSTISSRA